MLESSYLCGRINNLFKFAFEDKRVVICSKVPTFVVESTTVILKAYLSLRCDLLESSYLCGRINNEIVVDAIGDMVVICSKVPTFVVESTTYFLPFVIFCRL